MYSWPKICLPGKSNPPLHHLQLFTPGSEHTRVPKSGDRWQPMRDKRESVFFLPVLHGNGRRRRKTAPACRLLSLHHLVLRFSSSSTRWLQGPTGLNKTGSVQCRSRGPSLSVCLSRYKLQTSKKKKKKNTQSSSVPVRSLDKCEQNVHSFRFSHVQTPLDESGERPKGGGAFDWPIEQSTKASDLTSG